MLSDKNLMYIALVLVIVGIAGLFLVIIFISPKEMKIASITNAVIGQNVVVKGMVDSYYTKENHVFIDLNDTSGKIRVVMFENVAKNQPDVYNIEKDDNVIIEGKIELYKNELEIVATAIKMLKYI